MMTERKRNLINPNKGIFLTQLCPPEWSSRLFLGPLPRWAVPSPRGATKSSASAGRPEQQRAELRGEPVRPRDGGEIGPHPALPCASEPPPQARVPEEPFDLRRERLRVPGRGEDPVHPVLDELRDRGDPGRHARQALALGFEEDVGEAVPVAVPRDAAREHEYVRGT